MQAISGAGYPGVASMDINANVIPYIGGEEEKMQQETQKILGDYAADRITPLAAKVSAHCNRVPVVDGHTVTVSVELERKPSREEAIRAINEYRGVPQQRKLPSAPAQPVVYMEAQDRPQPRRDVERENGMTVFIGRLRECPVLDWKFIALGHNTVRGAAGAAVLNAELMYSEGLAGLTTPMIVMKFGGTSVESAAAIERVAGIVKARLDRHPVVVVSAMGKTTNRLLSIAHHAINGHRDEALRELLALRDFHLRESGMERTVDEHFQELSELTKGLAILGELTPRSIDAISSFGERLSSLIVAHHFQKLGLRTAPRRFAQGHHHRQPSHAGGAAVRYHLRAAGGEDSAAREGRRRRDGRIHRIHGIGRHDHAGARRIRFHGVHCGRGHRGRGDPDLDRRRRHAHRGPDHPEGRPPRADLLVRRSRRTGVLRREGAASGDGAAGGGKEHSGADSEFAAARSGGNADRRRGGAVHQRRQEHRVQEEHHRW